MPSPSWRKDRRLGLSWSLEPKWLQNDPVSGSINRDIIGDTATIEDWSGSVSLSNSQGLDLPGQASPNKQSESLGGWHGGAYLGKWVYSVTGAGATYAFTVAGAAYESASAGATL